MSTGDLTGRLFEALGRGSVEAVLAALADGADPNAVDETGRSALTAAYEKRGGEAYLTLIDAGAEVRSAPLDLHWVVTLGRPDVLARLLEAGADPNAETMGGPVLRAAAMQGEAEMAAMLLAAGADPNTTSFTGSALETAIECRHRDAANVLLDGGADLVSSLGTLLTLAVHKQMRSTVRKLIERGADVNERGPVMVMDQATKRVVDAYAHATPLLIAARLGAAEIVETLLQAGADPHLRDEDGLRAIERAEEKGHAAVVATLRQWIGKVPSRERPEDLLLLAAEGGDAAEVRRLLALGADPEARDAREKCNGATPLLLAARGGHGDAITTLLAAGAPVDSVDGAGRTPSMRAAEGGHASAMELLIAAGADMNATDAEQLTPLHCAVREGRSVECVRLLLNAKAKLTAREGGDLLVAAAELGLVDVVEALLDAGVKIDSQGPGGRTALASAAWRGWLDVMRLLLDRGAGVDVGDSQGWRPLAWACRGMEADDMAEVFGVDRMAMSSETALRAVEMLLAAGADAAHAADDGCSALARAVMGGDEELVRVLLDHGAVAGGFVWAGQTLAQQARRGGILSDGICERLEATTSAPIVDEEPCAAIDPVVEWGLDISKEPEGTPDFSAAADDAAYVDAVADLERRCGSRTQPVYGRSGVYSLHVDSRSGFDFDAARQAFAERGYTVVRLGMEYAARVAVLPTADKFEVMRAFGVQAMNYDLTTAHVVAWLRKLDADQPFELEGIEDDMVYGTFRGDVKDPRRLAEAMYRFCPDTVDQGVGSVSALEQELRESRRIFLWWD